MANIQKACKWLEEGKKIRVTHWTNGAYACNTDEGVKVQIVHGSLVHLQVGDLLADWEIFKESKIYHSGQRYIEDGGNEYLLAHVDEDLVGLISLRTGNRWTEPVKVQDHREITQSEFELITDSQSEVFKEVKKDGQ